MARGFWSKRKNDITIASNYMQATDSVSRPSAIFMTILGILIVGGLLFGVFSGTRWVYGKLSNRDSKPTVSVVKNDNNPTATSLNTSNSETSNAGTESTGPKVTVTSSTSTNTPSSTTTPASTTATKLPQTGPESQLSVFIAAAIIGYLIYRKRTISKNS